jgi:hypothetical protein
MTGPGAIEKPTVFLSHAATDEPIAALLHAEINRIFANGVNVFTSSVPGVVRPGADWLRSIRTNLEQARAVIVLITPISINRPWIWFEVGASWSRMEQGEGRILPVCVPEIEKSELPEPLGRLQALSLGKAAETRLLFQTLIDHFDFGTVKGYRHANIKAKLPPYPDLRVADADIHAGELYTGPYEAYSDPELEEVIDERYVLPAWREYGNRNLFGHVLESSHWRNYLFTEKLVHFRDLDNTLGLPPGTSKRLLVKVVTKRYPGEVAQQTENTVRFKATADAEEYE